MAFTILNLNNTTPAAPGGSTNVTWQFDASNPVNVSAYVANVSSLWSSLGNATADLILANANYATTFNQTSSVIWTWANTTAATGYTVQQNSPILTLSGSYWTGSLTGVDAWTLQGILFTNTPTDTESISRLTIGHMGAQVGQVAFPGGSSLGGITYPGVCFTSDPLTGLYDIGSSQVGVVCGGNLVAAFGNSGGGVLALSSGATLAGNGAQGFAYFTIDPNTQPAFNFNIPAGTPGSPTMSSIGLTQNSSDLTLTSWTSAQAGRTYFNTTTGLVKVYDGAELNTLAPVRVKSNLTAQSAAIAATTLFAVPTGQGGMYRITWEASITTADGVSSSLGGSTGFQVKYTNPVDSVVKTSNPTTATISAANTTGTSIGGVVTAYCKAGTNLQYIFGYTSATPGQMVYALNIYAEFMG